MKLAWNCIVEDTETPIRRRNQNTSVLGTNIDLLQLHNLCLKARRVTALEKQPKLKHELSALTTLYVVAYPIYRKKK